MLACNKYAVALLSVFIAGTGTTDAMSSLRKRSNMTTVEMGLDATPTSRMLAKTVIIGTDPLKKLGRCEGDCDSNDDCTGDLVCYQRSSNDDVPGCVTETVDMSRTDYCVKREDLDTMMSSPTKAQTRQLTKSPTRSPTGRPTGHPTRSPTRRPTGRPTRNPTKSPTKSPARSSSTTSSSNDFQDLAYVRDQQPTDPKLGMCEGDCDTDDDCDGNLVCFQRGRMQEVPGCRGGDVEDSLTDFCVQPDGSDSSDTRSSTSESDETSSSEDVTLALTANPTPSPVKQPPVAPMIVSSSSAYGGRSIIHLPRPSRTQVGDLLVLFLSRTDEPLPLIMDGWSPQASCFKQNNGQPWCITSEMCRKPDGDYCKVFRRNGEKREYDGHDLGTIVFTRVATKQDVNREEYYYNLRGGQPGWAILAVVRGASTVHPVRSHSGVTCDKVRQSLFASTYGKKNDLLLMHMGFDDTSDMEHFQPPSGSRFVSFTKGPDEAGFLFAETLAKTGQTGDRITQGRGASDCKDVNIAIVIRAGN